MRAFKILVMESISIHGSRSIQVKKKSKRNARCEYPDILCDRARKASPSCRKFCVLCSKLTSTPCIFFDCIYSDSGTG